MKAMFLAASVASVLASMPAFAHAADFTVTGTSRYIFERQALVLSRKPAVNLDASFGLGYGVSGDLWVQAGDKGAQELDASVEKDWKVRSTTVTTSVGTYLYPTTGFKPIYFAAVDTSTPLGPVAMELGVTRYEGDYKSTLTSIAFSGDLPISKGFTPHLTLGKAHDSAGRAPWYGRVSVPIGTSEKAPSIGVRGFWGAGSGFAFDLVLPL